jgi:hypothetical protein
MRACPPTSADTSITSVDRGWCVFVKRKSHSANL